MIFYKLGFLGFRLQTRVSASDGSRNRSRARSKARLRIMFKVVIIWRYVVEKVLSVDCINNLQN